MKTLAAKLADAFEVDGEAGARVLKLDTSRVVSQQATSEMLNEKMREPRL
jgi:hypothetical protein